MASRFLSSASVFAKSSVSSFGGLDLVSFFDILLPLVNFSVSSPVMRSIATFSV